MEVTLLKVLYGVWNPKLNGLKVVDIRGIAVLKNETGQRIIHSPSITTECAGLESHEIAANPGEMICYVKQQIKPGESFDSRVVIGKEPEMTRWIGYYYFEPQMAPSEVEIREGFLWVMNVPVLVSVFQAYPLNVRQELKRLIGLKDLTEYQQRRVEELFQGVGA